MLHPFLHNVTETILHIFRLLYLLFCNLYEVEGLTRFEISHNCNNCIMYNHFSSNFPSPLFIEVIKIQFQDFLCQPFPTASMLCSTAELQGHTPQRDCKNRTESKWCFHSFSWAKERHLEFWRSIYSDVLTRPFSIPFFFNILRVDVLKDVARITFVTKFFLQKIDNWFRLF